MLRSPSRPDRFTLPLAIRAVSVSLSSFPDRTHLACSIHCIGFQLGFSGDAHFCNALVGTYAKSGRIGYARQVFDEMCCPARDVVSWTSMMSGYVRAGSSVGCFRLFREMRLAGVEPNSVTLAVVLSACGAGRDGCGGRQLHCLAIKGGFESDELVGNSILTVFGKAGDLAAVERFFSSFERRSAVSWNVLMSGYLSRGELGELVHCFDEMRAESIPTQETLTLVISASAKCGDLLQGRKVHGFALKTAQIDKVLEASLLDFYAKCGEVESAVLLFEQVRAENCIVWNVMMWGFIQNGRFAEAVGLYTGMHESGHEPDIDTLRGLTLAYTQLGSLRLAKQVHGYLTRRSTLGDGCGRERLETSILNMYAKCGSIVSAQRCFDQMVGKDVIAWSSMVEGYAIHGLGLEALETFYRMEEEGIKPNSITFLSLLSACSHSGLVAEGVEVFDTMSRKYGIKPELNHYTCMVDLLGRVGELHEALSVINNMNVKPDARIWGALLSSCRVHSDATLAKYAAQELFELEPDNVGYHVILRNIQVSISTRDAAANSASEVRSEGDCFKKEPGWSCIEGKGRIHMFVSGDRSHPQIVKLYRVLACLCTIIQEEMTEEAQMDTR
ncbi:pentatricopeptide repeat-containing protein-like [Iris pallida]|uniref:Pentatricopeptide repeat-containing protein-like n=1 Tax=Iris pallida TaxID=29817 RepID=A0AAX6E2T0_IRIPA|nr:pentatricopeptide repeat-containing protein-like [Iris pallida]